MPQSQNSFRRNPLRKAAARVAFAGRGMAKLDKTLAEKIRAEAKHWKSRVLAKRYGVSERTISLILNDRTYAGA